ncbi:sigma-70 family RNA polymerase sigma factor [Brevibacillus daliensis]|uniref:sigma-70 family RNA polymerase sigma factor n=1 Tax=Brevibacillus daliensis TaxID=2892995 RepID=UPI001E598885|nr:sigma-70 family RNA polymerase sigma factor [Brevibacillus daliensis]
MELHKTNEAKLEWLMDEYGRRMLHLIFFLVKNKEVAEDLTQEVFLKAYRSLDSFRNESTHKTWLYRIAINEVKKYQRSWNYRKIFASIKIIELSDQHRQDSVEPQVINEMDKEEMTRIIMKLPLNYRQVIILHYYQELSVEEIAGILETSQGAIHNKLYRARNKLRALLDREEVVWTLRRN